MELQNHHPDPMFFDVEKQLHSQPFTFSRGMLPSSKIFHFTTDSELEYEVRFARKMDDMFTYRLNFGVLNDELEDEYALTNKGEAFRILATLVNIMNQFFKENPHVMRFEAVGEGKEGMAEDALSVRTRFYFRCAQRVLNKSWEAKIEGNRLILVKKDKRISRHEDLLAQIKSHNQLTLDKQSTFGILLKEYQRVSLNTLTPLGTLTIIDLMIRFF